MPKENAVFKRTIESTLKIDLPNYSVFCIKGPRFVGKTTLVKTVAPHFAYFSLRELQSRQQAVKNPDFFIRDALAKGEGMIVDDCEYAPAIIDAIRSYELPEGKKIIVTTSLLRHHSTLVEELFGSRSKTYTLWPLSITEREISQVLPQSVDDAILRGGFPAAQREGDIPEWYTTYVRNYTEQDVRVAKSLHNDTIFYRFMELCAEQSLGQPVNYSSLRRACEITIHTAKAWIELLELTQLIFLLPPHEQAYGKRIIKSPKLYFIEPAITCSLLRISTPEQLKQHPLREAIIESFVISDLYKQAFSAGKKGNISFWKDKAGHEVECLVNKSTGVLPMEIVANESYSPQAFKKLTHWYKVSHAMQSNGIVVYTGEQDQTLVEGRLLNWRSVKNLNQ